MVVILWEIMALPTPHSIFLRIVVCPGRLYCIARIIGNLLMFLNPLFILIYMILLPILYILSRDLFTALFILGVECIYIINPLLALLSLGTLSVVLPLLKKIMQPFLIPLPAYPTTFRTSTTTIRPTAAQSTTSAR